MLSRKVFGAGVMSAAAPVDRGRVGERLQAAVAGLQELHLLRDRQSDMVAWALRMDREEPVTSVQANQDGPGMMGTEEQRLEATLSALKQQLSRLRRQDVGLKTHLQQLDQQISELKLDVSKASTEQLESDSRPSSGFYELSDGGSCSLSNSCTSVYSECLSSSQTSLLIPPTSPATSHITSPLTQVDVCRRRSADESAAQPHPPRATGLHLGSSRIRTSTTTTERARPRPVSTGDLDRMMTLGPSCYKSVDGKKPAVCSSLKTSTVDPKFQSNLVSRSGTEVYHYPSPLHAVALQSPIFSPGAEPASPGFPEGLELPMDGGPGTNTLQRAQMMSQTGPPVYIDKLLQRSMTRINIGSEAEKETMHAHSDYHRKPIEAGTVFPEVSHVEVSPLRPTAAQTSDIMPADSDWNRHCMIYSSQEQVNHTMHNQSVRAPDASYRYSYPAATRETMSGEVITSDTRNNDKIQGDHTGVARGHSEKRCRDIPEVKLCERKGHAQRPVMTHSSSTEDSQGFEVQLSHKTPSDFVHAKFVPAGSQRVKVRQADRKTKAVKLRRKSSEKPRAVRHHQGYSSSERTREANGGAKGERELRRSGKGKTTQKLTTCLVEERGHSGSDSSLCSPGLMYSLKVHPKPHPVPTVVKSSKSRRPQLLEYEQPAEQRKRRQGTGKWPSDVEMIQVPCVQRQRSKEPRAQAAGSRQMVHSVSARPHLGQWVGPPRALHPSMSSSSFFNSLNARYPPAPFPMSSHYPPRCESEYSAECASLFHSTIAESSEGEMSDNTTNRFGDSESSQSFQSFSDSDSSLSLDEGDQVDSHEEEGGLVWAEAALGPTAAGLQLPRPEPPTCRIKASRALKKKIRRFQPASLKVMTLV
ncbi:dapper homolog 2 [Myripristis murdjan]|uniref:Dishevelled-binding antagonist of beta-catenin 2 n=1 Tax=Myripristis murdjan TaxID=586833 RepID=A0A667XS58_9TELE|nr:dapper homolog 2-like [Myripristis murdjan]